MIKVLGLSVISSFLILISGTRGLAKNLNSAEPRMVVIPGGHFEPFDSSAKNPASPSALNAPVIINEFLLDKYFVTNKDYLDFLRKHNEWRKSKVKRVFADLHYLQNWSSDLSFSPGKAKSPVVRVSWFAASAYCESIGKELPTTHQWEFALFDNGRNQKKLTEKILAWYGKANEPNPPVVGSSGSNEYGVFDLGSLLWEWTEDFNSFLGATSSNSDGKDADLFCGNGSQLGNPSDYAAFMRYSFRSSLKANYTTANLGFRCAKEKNQ